MYSVLTRRLMEALQQLPGIGPKSAQRLAFHLLESKGQAKGLHLAESLQLALTQVKTCACCRFFTEQGSCELCNNPRRDKAQLCVVETPADVVAIEQTQSYRGLYFVLQGRLSPLDGIGPEDIGIPQLLRRITSEGIRELILATNWTSEGRATSHYIVSQINTTHVRCTRIAHGVPLGGELEYLDGSTLSHALMSRLPIDASI